MSVDDIVSDSDRKKNSVSLRPALRRVPVAVQDDHRGDARQVPDGLDAKPTAGTGLRPAATRSSSSPAAPLLSNDHDVNICL